MPIALENSSRNASNELPNVDSTAAASKASPEAAARLTNLLISDPIDLAGISDEIRRSPGLDALVLRLGISLALSPDEPLNTVEEAVVVLGTSRLRVLIDLWSSADSPLPQQVNQRANERVNGQENGQRNFEQNDSRKESALAVTPEARYLTNFLRCLGCECSENALSGPRLAAWTDKVRHDQVVALTDIFMRDFFSLLPTIQPGLGQFAAPSPKHRQVRQ